MLHAVQAPVFKLTAVGGAALALALGARLARPAQPARPAEHLTEHRLTLHAPSEPDALYLTAFDHGDITITRDDAHLRPFTIDTCASLTDGCTWLGIEHFVPIDAHVYRYSYNEKILSCEPGAIPAIKTPRTGYVTVDQ